MKKLLNLCNNERIEKDKTIYSTLKLRQEFISLALNSDNLIKTFCISFQEYNSLLLNKFISEILCDKKLNDFVDQCEDFVLSIMKNSEVKYNDIFNKVFPFNNRYFDISEKISAQSGFCSLKYLYMVINYIDDKLPIVLKEELCDEEETFLDFLLNYGDEKMYSEKYGMHKKVVNKLIKKVCEKHGDDNLNETLNIALIQKFLKKNKGRFFKKS